jgi:hypothetical protein
VKPLAQLSSGGVARGSRRSRDGARALLGDDELPGSWVEGRDRILDGHLHLICRGGGCSGAWIDRALPNHEQRPVGSDTARHAAQHFAHDVHVQADDEIVARGLDRPRREVVRAEFKDRIHGG